MADRVTDAATREAIVLDRIAAFRRRRPRLTDDVITLAHGAGGKASAALVDAVFLDAFAGPDRGPLPDAAILELPGGDRLAFSTDTFVVAPRRFPGGSIGHLAVHGTVNDVAVQGGRPAWLSAAFVIEEGFAVAELRAIVADMAEAARAAGVRIVTGDTKVVGTGAADGVFISTAGMGVIPAGRALGPELVRPGDRVLVSGTIGDHGMAVLLARGDLALEADIRSDTAPVNGLVEAVLAAAPGTRWLRDPTRGGVGTVCNELARDANVAVVLEETALPVDAAVLGACDLLGIDPLYVANEGKVVAVVAPEEAEAALVAMRSHPLGASAAVVGEIAAEPEGIVVLRTGFGGTRIVDMLVGDPLAHLLSDVSGEQRTRFRVSGTVQGVGFRPFVYRQAIELGLSGFVLNDSDGVLIEVQGTGSRIDAFARALRDEVPPLARVEGVVAETIAVRADGEAFTIEHSTDVGAPAVPVSVDTAPCAACLAEVADPRDRRYRYPFTNCTDCGPRYTIVLSVPYDRPATTMARFVMCPACQAEYDDPADRRFHAQPNACPVCGPQVSWRDPAGAVSATGDDAVTAAVGALRRAAVVAIKGVGGYHLAVDATSAGAVAALRRRKARDDKPFAVMVVDLEAARDLCDLDLPAEAALVSSRRPIVLAPRRAGSAIVDAVAPGLPELGIMLPYSPLHHLLLDGVGRPLVMTSGNLSDEPIAHDDADAIARLGPLVDGMLTHDRPIHIRCDDSVRRAALGRVQQLRRSRGEAPEPIRLPFDASAAPVLAVGAELKSTIAVTKGHHVVASHHIGDLEHLATYRSFLQAVEHLPRLYGVEPAVVAHDLHPEYLSTKFAAELGVPTVGVQHHHAHAASCLVEHGRTDAVLAVCFDGLGYGPDGTLWGGELLVADLARFRRVGHLRPVVLPGGAAAIREPWRMAASWLSVAAGADDAIARLTPVDARAAAVVGLAEHGGGPATTAMGRLFDAVAALLGGRARVTFEAQAAIELEAAARTVPRALAPTYDGTVEVRSDDGVAVLDPSPLLRALLADHDAGSPRSVLAAGFHEAIGRAAARVAASLAGDAGLDTVALTGGVFQNVRLTEVVESALLEAGCQVLVHEQIPANDGGISVGQAAIAAWRTLHC